MITSVAGTICYPIDSVKRRLMMQVRTCVCTNETSFHLFVPSRLTLTLCVCFCVSHHIISNSILFCLVLSYHLFLSHFISFSSIISHRIVSCVWFQCIYLTLFPMYLCMYMRTCTGASFNFNFNFNTWCPIVSREWNYPLQVSNNTHTHTHSHILFNFNLEYNLNC